MICKNCGTETPVAYGICEGCGLAYQESEKGNPALCFSCGHLMKRRSLGDGHCWYCENGMCHRAGLLTVIGKRSSTGRQQLLVE